MMNPNRVHEKNGLYRTLPGLFIGLFFALSLLAAPVAAADETNNLNITGTVNPVPGTAVFAKEPNTVKIMSIKNTGTITLTNITVALYASDVSNGTIVVNSTVIESLAAGSTTSPTIIDPTIRDLENGTLAYTAVLDPDNLIAETNESDNGKTSTTKTVKYNGYKGKRYWEGGSDIAPQATYDLSGGVLYYTQPDSAYQSVDWVGRTETWNANDLILPAGATVENVFLYLSYNWDTTPGGVPNWTADFNGNTLTNGTLYTDKSNFGGYADFKYGLYRFNVTRQFSSAGNSLVLTPGSDNSNAIYPSTLVIVYRDANETRKQIFVNEECDYLLYSDSYGTTLDEATAFAPFTGITLNTSSVQNATLYSFAGGAGPDEGNLLFNGNPVGTNAWQGTTSTANASVTDVKSYLADTGNIAAIQGTTSGGMLVLQQILVVEYNTTPAVAPVTSFTANATSGTVPLTVIFTDTSTNSPTSWFWDFGDGTNATEQNATHTYTTAGTYSVNLTAMNDGGSNSNEITGYITASEAATPTPTPDTAPVVNFTVTATNGLAPVTASFTDTSTNTPTAWIWEYRIADNGIWIPFSTDQNPSHDFSDAGTYDIRLTAGNAAGNSTRVRTHALAAATARDLLTTVETGTVSGDLYVNTVSPFTNTTTQTFTLPAIAVGNVTWARLYVDTYGGSIAGAYGGIQTVQFDGITLGIETMNIPATSNSYAYPVNDHVMKVSSDYEAAYDVTGRITQANPVVSISSVPISGLSQDNRVKGITLVVAYNDGDSDQVKYIVNHGSNWIGPRGETNSTGFDAGTFSVGWTNVTLTTVAHSSADAIYTFNGNNINSSRNSLASGSYLKLNQWNLTSALNAGSTNTLNYTVTGTSFKTTLATLAVKYSAATTVAPVASFASDVTSGNVPLTVNFTDTSSNTPTRWSWDFGDGTNATEQNVTHTFLTAGTYTANLTAANSAGSSSSETAITVGSGSGSDNPEPVALYTASATSGTVPLAVQFTDLSENAVSWYWDFGDGSNSTVQNATHIYSTAGIYTVNLTVTNSTGASSYLANTGYITVTEAAATEGLTTVVHGTVDGEMYVASTANWDSKSSTKTFTVPNGTVVFARYYVGVWAGQSTHTTIATTFNGHAFETSPSYYASGLGVTWIPYNVTDYVVAGETNTATVNSSVWGDGRQYGSTLVVVLQNESMPETEYWITEGLNWLHYDNGDGAVDSAATTLAGTVSLADVQNASLYSVHLTGYNYEDLNGNSLPSAAASVNGEYFDYLRWDGVEGLMAAGSQTVNVGRGEDTYCSPVFHALAVTYKAYDLVPVNLTPSVVTSGTSNTLTATLENRGTKDAPAFNVSLLVDGTRVDTQIVAGLASGNSTIVDFHWTPDGSAASYTLTVVTDSDNEINEANESNNSLPVLIGTSSAGMPVAEFSADTSSGNAPLTVNFTDLSTNSPISWAWDFENDGIIDSTEQNATHTYTIPATYTVNLTVTNAGGPNSSVKTGYITVSAITPIANFTATPTSGGVPLSVNFTDTSMNVPTAWAWDFNNDGSIDSTEQNPNHIYTTAGSYTVNLTVTNSAGTDDEVKTSYIAALVPSAANFSATPTSGSAPLTVTFTDHSENSPTSWLWDFGDGSTSTSQNASHTYSAIGSYTVRLTATNLAGNTSVAKTGYISVSAGSGPVWVANSAGNLPDVGDTSAPEFADLDGDGDFDLLIAAKDGISYAYENTGSTSSPVWTAKSAWNVPDIGASAALGFADLDSDSDYDLMIGKSSGIIQGYENTGSATSPVWAAKFAWDTTTTVPYGAPALADLDWDGDYDLMVGNSSGYTNAYENTGSAASPVWTVKSAWNVGDIGSRASPGFADVDGDGDYDLLIGAGDGISYAYENTGSATSPVWTAKSLWNAPDVNVYAAPALADLDGDGDNDVIIGENGGISYSYQNIAGSLPDLTPTAITQASDTIVSSPVTITATINNRGAADVGAFVATLSIDGSVVDTRSVLGPAAGSSATVNFTWTPLAEGGHSLTLAADPISGISESDETNNVVTTTVSVPGSAGVITVAPVASFFANVTSGTAPLTVLFTDTSIRTPTGWTWDFGDGSNSIRQSPVHTYTAAGNYTVSLTAMNSAGSNSRVVAAYISVRAAAVAPVASFTADVTNGTVPLTVNFTDSSTNTPTSWSWDFGDGRTATTQNVAHTYAAAGTYTVNLTATNLAGSSSSESTITVTSGTLVPVALYSANATSGTAPFPVQFQDISENSPTGWYWDFGDGINSTVRNATHTYTTAGVYTVNLTVTNAAGSDSLANTGYITVSTAATPTPTATPDTVPSPVANFTGSPITGTAPVAVTFNDTSSGNATGWTWSFGDGNSSTVQNPVHTYTAAGNYTVVLIAANVGGSSSAIRTNYITVTAAVVTPVANFTANKTEGDNPLSVKFTDKSINTPTTWSWDFGDSSTSAEQNPVHQYTAAGRYTVKLTATNPAGSNLFTRSGYITVIAPVVESNNFAVTGVSTTTEGTVQNVTIDTTSANVTTAGNVVTINGTANWATLAITLTETPDTTNATTLNGTVETVTAITEPVTVPLTSVGTPTVQIQLNLDEMPATTAVITQTVTKDPDATAQTAFTLAATSSGNQIDDIAYTLNVAKNNLANAGDGGIIQSAMLTMTVSPTWVAAHGGVGNIRVFRQADDGTTQILTPTLSGTDSSGNYIFTVLSPNGLSTFSLAAVSAVTSTTTTTSGTSSSSSLDSDSVPSVTTQTGPSERLSTIVSAISTIASGESTTIAVNQPISASVPIGISKVKISAARQIAGTDLIVQDGGSVDLSPLDNRAVAGIQQIEPVGVNPSAISQATITFAVSKSWLTSHNLGTSDVVLARNTNGNWVDLPTTFDSQSGDICYFTATTPGFSYFAVTGKAAAATSTPTTTSTISGTATQNAVSAVTATPAAVTPKSTAAAQAAPTQTTGAPIASSSTGSNGLPLTTIAIASVAVIIAIAGIIFGRRWWIQRQNPDLFRDYK